jgi:hypothetical protein
MKGDCMASPRGSVHGFSNPFDEPSRALVVQSPDIGSTSSTSERRSRHPAARPLQDSPDHGKIQSQGRSAGLIIRTAECDDARPCWSTPV